MAGGLGQGFEEDARLRCVGPVAQGPYRRGTDRYCERQAMALEYMVVKALSISVFLGMDYQKAHVKAIYPGTESVV